MGALRAWYGSCYNLLPAMTTALPSRCHFDRGKIFAPLVVNYIASLVGFKELVGHGVDLALRAEAQRMGVSERDALAELRKAGANLPEFATEERRTFELLAPLNLASVAYSAVPVDVAAIASELLNNGTYLATRLLPFAAGGLLVGAYETAKAKGYTTRDPIWEFLRHCRNAVSHGNRFNLLGSEPARPANWAGLDITRSLQGTILFQEEQHGQHFLRPGDPVHLLWDIEQAYPSLAA